MLAARVDTHTRRAAPEPEPAPTKLASCSTPLRPLICRLEIARWDPGPKLFWCADGWAGGIGRNCRFAATRMPHCLLKAVPNDLLPKRASSKAEISPRKRVGCHNADGGYFQRTDTMPPNTQSRYRINLTRARARDHLQPQYGLGRTGLKENPSADRYQICTSGGAAT